MTGQRARRKPGENRGHLLKAGLVEFGLFGYHGASTATIAARAGVPQPHVYASFRTKQELFLTVCEHAFDALTVEEGAPDEEAYGRILLQAYAAVAAPTLAGPLGARLAALEARMPDARRALLLRTAADRLVAERDVQPRPAS